MKRIFAHIACAVLCSIANAQAIDNTLSYKYIPSEKYFRLSYENDFFSAYDIYYTQGVNMELVTPGLRKSPLNTLLIRPHFADARYGIGIEHNGYTPTSIDHYEILNGDRPFAGCLLIKTFQVSTDAIHLQRFSTTLSTGIIGPAALAAEMQTDIHRALNNVIPKGWENQVHNDVILNYQVDYEKQLASYKNLFSLDGNTVVRVGTLSDKISIGLTGMIGYFDSPFKIQNAVKRRFRLYGYDHPEISLIGYDATLQGGLFNKTSPYLIPDGQVTRVVFQNRFGFGLKFKNIYLEYFQTYLSKEFKTGLKHKWGGIQIALGI